MSKRKEDEWTTPGEIVGGILGGIVGGALGVGCGIATRGRASSATVPFIVGGVGVGATVGRKVENFLGSLFG